MSSKHRSVSGWIKFLGILIAGFILLALILFLIIRNSQTASLPVVSIASPGQGEIFSSGKEVQLIAVSEARRGLQKIDFYVDENFQASYPAPLDETSSQVTFPWFPSQIGIHQLSLIAYDHQGRSSQPASLMVGVKPESPPVPVIAVEDGQQPEIDETQAANPDSEAAGAEQSDQQQDDDEEAEDPSAPLVFLGEEQLVELLEQAVPDGQFPVEFADQPPLIEVVPSLERIEGGSKASLIMEAEDDIGLDYISLSLFSNGQAVDTHTYPCGGLSSCRWSFDIFFSEGEWNVVIQAYDSIGQASETFTYTFQNMPDENNNGQALVLNQGDSADHEEVVPISQADAFGAPRITGTDCDGRLIELGVPYRYISDHGEEVFVGAWAQKDDIMVAAGITKVEHGSGMATFIMEPIAPDLVETTDQLQLHFMTPDGEFFYKKTVDIELTWSIPLPDLTIQEVLRSIDGDEITIQVSNKGCSSVKGFELTTETEEGPGPLRNFQDTIYPGGTKEVTLYNLNPNLYSRLFDVQLDPDNKIEEVNENNNVHLTFPIRLDYVHISKIDIHDTSDGEWHQNPDQGEFRLFVTYHGTRIERPRGEDLTWVLPKGSWDIQGFVAPIYLRYDLDWNHDLRFLFEVIEYDDLGDSDHTLVKVLHPWDMYDTESWKWNHGQEQLATTNNGKYTIHYWVILKE